MSNANLAESTITPEIVESHGFTPEEYESLLSILGREPSMVELGIYSVMWSEHCSYKSTRAHIGKLHTEGEQVICGPGENAGVIDAGDNDALIFKMESHNHPSYIEPYQGAATGVGGIMRDIFTMGARPICNLNALRFGEIDHPKTNHLLNGVVSGIGGYGNCMGVPTVGGETQFHAKYNDNILVNAMCVGLADKDKIFYSAAAEVGATVLYAGARTGRDGIHGATMSSAEFDDSIEEKRPTVQVGDPFVEKKVLEACLELMKKDCIIAIQDMGAAGITCSSIEMADKGGTGIELDLDKVPTREENMTAYEIMLSESQERMLMVIKPEKEHLAKEVFDKWELSSAAIGKITDTGRMIVKMGGEVYADMLVEDLASSAPKYERPYVPTPKREMPDFARAAQPQQLIDDLKTMMGLPDICSKKYIAEQYDYKVMNDTVFTDGDAAVVRIHGTDKGVAVTSDCNPRYVEAAPYEGGMQAVVETYRNISATGATPLAITNCLNFGNPEKPEVMGQIVGAIEGMRDACKFLNYPVVSGNASLYNETKGKAIRPTPTIGGVGIIKDYRKAVSVPFKGEKNKIIRIGDMEGYLGGSLYLEAIVGHGEHTPPPAIDLEAERKNAEFVRFCIDKGWVSACHDISDGGQLVAIAEMAVSSGIGCNVNIANDYARAFGEEQARYIITVPEDFVEYILTSAPDHDGVEAMVIGETGGTVISLNGEAEIGVKELQKIYFNSLEEKLG